MKEFMNECMNEWVYEWMNVCMNEWIRMIMNEWINTNKWTNEWISLRMNERMNEWIRMNEWMNGTHNDRMNKLKDEWLIHLIDWYFSNEHSAGLESVESRTRVNSSSCAYITFSMSMAPDRSKHVYGAIHGRWIRIWPCISTFTKWMIELLIKLCTNQ